MPSTFLTRYFTIVGKIRLHAMNDLFHLRMWTCHIFNLFFPALNYLARVQSLLEIARELKTTSFNLPLPGTGSINVVSDSLFSDIGYPLLVPSEQNYRSPAKDKLTQKM